MVALTLHEGDCLEVLAQLPEAHFDAIVTDPPYHLTSIVKRFGGDAAAEAKHGTDGLFQRSSKGFMGKTWDGGDIAFRQETWAAALRVLKPGGHLVAFNHSRTYHHMAVAIELAGFELRDCIQNLYGAEPAWSVFLDTLQPEQIGALARAMEAASPSLLAWFYGSGFPKSHDVAKGIDKLLGVERESLGLDPQKSGKKRNSMAGGFAGEYHITQPASPEAADWAGHGTALKPAFEPIVLARKPLQEKSVARQYLATGTGGLNIDAARIPADDDQLAQKYASVQGTGARHNNVFGSDTRPRDGAAPHEAGRWPANICHDGSPEVLAKFPQEPVPGHKIATQSMARFFYSGKATKADRRGSKHPTVKPQELMRWLVRLTTARGGRVLDMFAGSGATGWAAAMEGRECHLIERDPGYAEHIRTQLADFDPEKLTGAPALQDADSLEPDLFGGES
ncbi:site-specific DNA-methyltransferase [Epibacterium sp. SM1979]|uniref:site-specific DNA-methyltransferase (adenine-specific) n=1 Tax=Tritonibacter litoralis TaxID=2662264 RepID=A0A843YGY7_9RHOB|nr:DNA methyltransferase [Tritonibacter litoralis]MQQ09088.1 site-specific DNA-methyltransferase [Tritonibacter litoralis]